MVSVWKLKCAELVQTVLLELIIRSWKAHDKKNEIGNEQKGWK